MFIFITSNSWLSCQTLLNIFAEWLRRFDCFGPSWNVASLLISVDTLLIWVLVLSCGKQAGANPSRSFPKMVTMTISSTDE
jgi:hypothetical protein